MFFKFLWNDKGDKIKRKVMISDSSEGGLKMIDITTLNKSHKATWIKKYLNTENCSKWKVFFDLELATYGGNAVFKGNLNKKDIGNLNIEDPFVKEVIEIWSETFFEKGIVSKDHFLALPLWQNSLIRINNAPVLCKDWLSKGITQVKHLMDDSNNFLSLASFQNKYPLKVRPLTFFGIISAVKPLQQQIPRSQLKYDNFMNTFLKHQKPSRIVYKKLISNQAERPLLSQERWQKDIGSTAKVKIDWRKAYLLSAACTKSSKLIDFNFRFLHRRLATNNFLQKIGIREDGTCTFCHDKKEDLLHLFWGCGKSRIFWNDLSIWLQACHMLSKENHLGMETALGLKPDDSNFKLQINFFCLMAKHYIWICRSKERSPTQTNFLLSLKQTHQLENNTKRNSQKWKPLLSPLQRVS